MFDRAQKLCEVLTDAGLAVRLEVQPGLGENTAKHAQNEQVVSRCIG